MTFLRIQPAYECGLDVIPHWAIRQLHNDESVITRQRPVLICAVEKSRILHDDPCFSLATHHHRRASVLQHHERRAKSNYLSAPSGKLLPGMEANPHFQGQIGIIVRNTGWTTSAATLEVLHVDVAGGGHRALEGADEVGLAVRLVARSEQHLSSGPTVPTVWCGSHAAAPGGGLQNPSGCALAGGLRWRGLAARRA